MNSDLTELIKKYTIKKDRLLKKICAPLGDHLGISTFAYYTIEENGRFAIMSNYPEQLDFFYSEKMYLTCPYLAHPHLFRSGVALIPLSEDPAFLQLSRKLHRVDHLFLILQQLGNRMEGFFFIKSDQSAHDCHRFFEQLDLLKKFGRHFKREAKTLIDSALRDNFNVYKAKGAAFENRDATLPLSSNNPKVKSFLKKTTALSPQENRCLELFKQGNSAQATAAILGLSRRTVENYFENIKIKLGCTSKWELLDW